MREVVLHIDDKSHPIDVHCDSEIRPCSGFLLVASVPADPPGCVLLNYGNSSVTGNMIMTLYQRSVHEHPELAWVLEQVSRGIVAFADAERDRWPSDDRCGKA
jgi:hypothetical protein